MFQTSLNRWHHRSYNLPHGIAKYGGLKSVYGDMTNDDIEIIKHQRETWELLQKIIVHARNSFRQ